MSIQQREAVTAIRTHMLLWDFFARVMSRGRRSNYLRGIAMLSSGQLVAAVIPFLTAPVLGRIYRPEDYAPLATYVAVVSLVTAIATFHFQHGVLVETTSRRAHQVAWLALAAMFSIAILTIPIEIGIDLVVPLPAVFAEYREWFAAIPFSIFVAGTSLTAMAVANRAKAYRILAVMQFSAAAASSLASTALGLMRLGAHGLLTAYFINQLITLGFSLWILARQGIFRSRPGIRKLSRLAFRHRGYPFFTLPAALLQSIGLQLPVLALTTLGTAATLGAFSRAQQLLFLPISLFSSAIGRVYFQRATSDYNRTGSCRTIFLKTTLLVSVLAVPFLLIFAILGESIFTLYLGSNWSEAGRIAQIICPVFALQMFVGPLSCSLLFTGNQRLSLYLQATGVLIAILASFAPLAFSPNPYRVLEGWVAALSALACGQIYVGWRLARAPTRDAVGGEG